MRYDSFKHHRRSIRLKGYDYSWEGAYFVTICAQNREYLLESEPVRHMIQTTWNALSHRFPTVELDEFVIMPNHVHGIIWIVGAPLGAPQIGNPDSKQGATRRGAASSAPTLARVIRTEEDLNQIRQYIQDNPDNWEKDPENVNGQN